VREAILRLESSAPQDPAPRDAALESLRKALAALEQADLHDRAAIVHRQAAADAPRSTELLREELAAPLPVESPLEGTEVLPLAELETALAGAGGELVAARAEAEQVQAGLPAREQRRTAIAARLGEIQQQLVALDDQVRTAAGAPAGDDVSSAPFILALSRRRELAAESELLRAEQVALEAERELYRLRRERAVRRTGALERRVAALEEQVAARRAEEAARAAAEAERRRIETIERYPELDALAEENERLAARRTGASGLAERIRIAREELHGARAELAAVRDEFASTLRKVQAVGLTDAMGRVLRRQLEGRLPREGSVADSVRRTQRELGEVQYDLIIFDELREESLDIPAGVARVSSELGLSADRAVDQEVRAHAEALLRARVEHLEALADDLAALSDLLSSLVATRAEFGAITDAYRGYVEERILWVPSATSRLGSRVEPARRAIAAYADRAEWSRAIDISLGFVRERIALALLAGLVVAGLLALRRPLDRRSESLAESVRHHSTDRFSHTWRELLHTALRAAPLPIALYLVSVALSSPEGQVPVATATGQALENSAWRLAVLLVLAAAMRPRRLAEAHFRWPASGVASIQRNLWWLAALVIPAAFAVSVATILPVEGAVESIGVLAFEVAGISIIVFVLRALGPKGEFVSSYLRRNPGSLVGRASRLWFPVAIAVPLGLGALAMVGYVYTALEIWNPYERTFLLLLSIVLANELLLRWLFIARRRLAVEQALARRKAKEATPGAPPGALEPVEEDQVDIPALDAQTKQLFRAGILVAFGFGIAALWSHVLPALRFLDRVEVYPEMRWVAEENLEDRMLSGRLALAPAAVPAAPSPPPAAGSGAEPASGGNGGAEPAAGAAPAAPPPGRPAPPLAPAAAKEPVDVRSDGIVTLADLLAALLLGFLTFVALKNIPAVLEIAVLQRLPLDRGARYAIRTIVRYVLLIVGVSLAFGAVGIGWSSIQWLAAALTFGLAFGLQEIFANFVSGVIILLERPMRVGDTVTVAGIEGKVLRLQMRSTTIQDYDQRELLVPNKEFITGSLINWTLTEPTSRLVFPVGIAYGSDVEKATRILLDVAKRHPDVLADPPPSVVFVKFGESSLDLVLRLFIPHRDHWAPVTHAVHCAIDAAFREAGIEIAFPQRDLHLRSAPALDRFGPERGARPPGGASGPAAGA